MGEPKKDAGAKSAIEQIKKLALEKGGIYASLPEADGTSDFWIRSDGRVYGEGYGAGRNKLADLPLSVLASIAENHVSAADAIRERDAESAVKDWLIDLSQKQPSFKAPQDPTYAETISGKRKDGAFVAQIDGVLYKANGTPEQFMSGVYSDGRLKAAEYFERWLAAEKNLGTENEGALKTTYKPGMMIGEYCLIEQTSWVVKFDQQPAVAMWGARHPERCIPGKEYVAFFCEKDKQSGLPVWNLYDQEGAVGSYSFTPSELRPTAANHGIVNCDKLAKIWADNNSASPESAVDNAQIWSVLENAAGPGKDAVKSLIKPLVENAENAGSLAEGLQKIRDFAAETNLRSLSEMARNLAENLGAANGKLLYVGGTPVAGALNLRRIIETNGNLETRDASGNIACSHEETERILTENGWRRATMPFNIGQAWTHAEVFDEKASLDKTLEALRARLAGLAVNAEHFQPRKPKP